MTRPSELHHVRRACTEDKSASCAIPSTYCERIPGKETPRAPTSPRRRWARALSGASHHRSENQGMRCPLCSHDDTRPFHLDRRRHYLQCARCQLVFVPPIHHLTRDEERAAYELHQNHPGDMGYRRFLSRVFDPLCARLTTSAHGLDFGCGPGPTLSVMLEEVGHTMTLYDPFFFADPAWRCSVYDFITATEVVEHLHAPGDVLTQLTGLLKPQGWLAIMTKRVRDREAFATWHYKNDPTHVCFFHDDTFRWLAEHLHLRLEFTGADVVMLQRS